MQPVALIRGPTAISSCPGTAVNLDGSRSSGGGIKPLAFQWAAHPIECDDYYALQAQLAPQASDEVVELLTSAGSSFHFSLTITNFLGASYSTTVTVARSASPTPTVTITSPSLLEARGTARVVI